MNINQSVVNNNVRRLQSRAAKRGQFLAQLEDHRTQGRFLVSMIRMTGGVVSDEMRDAQKALRDLIKVNAQDQSLDRQLLKQQYELQRAERRRLKRQFKTGV